MSKSYGSVDFVGAELRNHRAHVYATLAAMLADVSSAPARVVYCTETSRHYFGKPGTWIGLGAASSFGDTSPNLAGLPAPGASSDGDVRVVLDDGTSPAPTLYVYDVGSLSWKRISDSRIVTKDGSVLLTGILSVTDANIQIPVNPSDLVTKKYADDVLAAHIANASAHSAAIATGASAAVATHAADGSAHSAAISTAIATHAASGSAHSTQIDAAIVAAVGVHMGDSAAHSAAFSTHNTAPTSHAAVFASRINEHSINPYAHTPNGVVAVSSRSGNNAKSGLFVIDAIHGSPVSHVGSAFTSRYIVVPRGVMPLGLAWKTSTKTTVGSTSITFASGTSKVTGLTGIIATAGDLVTFPSAVTNTGFFQVVASATGELTLNPAPVNEGPVASTQVVYKADGVVVYSGDFTIDTTYTVVASTALASTVANRGDGNGYVTHGVAIASTDIRRGDTLVIAGTVSSNGSYPILEYDYANNRVVVAGVLPSSETAVGTFTINHTGQTTSFSGSTPASPVQYYVDNTVAQGYSTTISNYTVAQQITATHAIVNIGRIDKFERATVTANTTLNPESYQFVPINFTAGGGVVTLPTGVQGMIVDIKDNNGNAVTFPVTISRAASQTIDGAVSISINTAYRAARLTFRATEWKVS